MFIHFDKNVYSNNETIYFTAYLIRSGISSITDHQILCVNLVREIDTSIILTEKFSMEKGLSMGSIVIPDSIQSGNYRLIAYTDQLLNGVPDVSFVQKITLKSSFDPLYKASLKILQSDRSPTTNHNVLLSATTNDNRFLAKPIMISYRYGNVHHKTKTDASGQVLLSIPSVTNSSDPNLYVKLSSDKDTSYLSVGLPSINNKASVKFFPEGGNSVTGLANYVAWEVKDQREMPLALKAFLFKNSEVIDTIETGSYGMGKFKLFYEHGAKYTVKLIHDGLADSVYSLPSAVDEGMVLNINKAVASDTLSFTIRSMKSQAVNIYLHNFKESFTTAQHHIRLGLQLFKMSLQEIPEGLATITITDSLNRPLAERMIFAHYQNRDKVTSTLDREQYRQREEVTLKLASADTTASIVSIAVVQDNRMDPLKTKDIQTYVYLQEELSRVPVSVRGSLFKDRESMEQLLLVKGWRKYNWQDLDQHKEKGAMPMAQSGRLEMTGKVWRKNKELVNPITLTVLGDQDFRVITTSESGSFNFNSPDLLTTQGRKTYLMVNEKVRENFNIKIDDQFLAISQRTKNLGSELIVPPSNLTNTSELLLKGNEKAIRLKEVVIKSTKDDRFHFSGPLKPGANACGDYVCMYQIFNCRNHISDPGNTQPVPGKTYNGLSGPYLECKVYGSSDQSFTKFKGIHFAKEFYQNDYNDPNEPAWFSTIYWNYGIILKSGRPIEIKFHTSDIVGKFRLVVQGINTAGLVHHEKTFEVRADQPKK